MKDKHQKIEVAAKFLVCLEPGDYARSHAFETRDEAVEYAQRKTFEKGSEVLVYQAVEKAVPNTKEVKVEKLS